MIAEIKMQLAKYIREQILKRPKFVLKDDDALISSGLIDSFHLVDLAVYIEESFGVRIEDTELNSETFDTLEQLANLVRKRLDQSFR